MDFQKIIDLFFFKEKDTGDNAVITTGAIIWGTLLRSFILMVVSTILIRKYMLYDYIYFLIFILWFFIAMPAYKAYQNFDKDMEDFTESTLCGTCRNFEKSAQLCKIYDQHPTKNFIPCDGLSWEPKTYEESQG